MVLRLSLRLSRYQANFDTNSITAITFSFLFYEIELHILAKIVSVFMFLSDHFVRNME